MLTMLRFVKYNRTESADFETKIEIEICLFSVSISEQHNSTLITTFGIAICPSSV